MSQKKILQYVFFSNQETVGCWTVYAVVASILYSAIDDLDLAASVYHDLVVDAVLIAVHFLLFVVLVLLILFLLLLSKSGVVLDSRRVPNFQEPVIGPSEQLSSNDLHGQTTK